MELIFGTTNQAKIQHMREMLTDSNIEIIGLNDFDLNYENIDESGKTPLENAKIKAMAYFKALRKPVFSCDTGLYIEGLDSKDQPGAYVRRVDGRELNDEEMIEYYGSIAAKSSRKVVAKYKNAICLILNEDNIFQYDGNDISSAPFIITSKIHPLRNPGYPLDSISIDIKSGLYFIEMYSMRNSENDDVIRKGYSDFFFRALK